MSYLQEVMQQSSLDSLGIASTAKLFFQDGLAAAAEAASHSGPAHQNVWMQDEQTYMKWIEPIRSYADKHLYLAHRSAESRFAQQDRSEKQMRIAS